MVIWALEFNSFSSEISNEMMEKNANKYIKNLIIKQPNKYDINLENNRKLCKRYLRFLATRLSPNFHTQAPWKQNNS